MKKIISILLLIALIIISSFAVYVYYKNKHIQKLEVQLTKLMETQTPIKFKIEKRINDTIFLKVKFYTLDKEEISEKNYKLVGNELAFDFYIFTEGKHNFAFPYKVFTDKIAPKNGITIAKEYNSEGFPAIFSFKEIETEEFEYLSDKYKQILQKKFTFVGGFGNLVHDIKKLKQFKTGVVYKIIVHSKGGIEVLEN